MRPGAPDDETTPYDPLQSPLRRAAPLRAAALRHAGSPVRRHGLYPLSDRHQALPAVGGRALHAGHPAADDGRAAVAGPPEQLQRHRPPRAAAAPCHRHGLLPALRPEPVESPLGGTARPLHGGGGLLRGIRPVDHLPLAHQPSPDRDGGRGSLFRADERGRRGRDDAAARGFGPRRRGARLGPPAPGQPQRSPESGGLRRGSSHLLRRGAAAQNLTRHLITLLRSHPSRPAGRNSADRNSAGRSPAQVAVPPGNGCGPPGMVPHGPHFPIRLRPAMPRPGDRADNAGI